MNPVTWQSPDTNWWLLIPLLLLGTGGLNAFVLWRLQPIWPKTPSRRRASLGCVLLLVIFLFAGHFGHHRLLDAAYYLGLFWASTVMVAGLCLLVIMLFTGLLRLRGGDVPFRWLIAMHHNQLQAYEAQAKMYVGRAWGSTELPISRIGARPEIAVITIRNHH